MSIAQPTMQFAREQQIRQLALEIRSPSAVSAMFVHRIIEIETSGSVTKTRHVDDPAPRHLEHRWEQSSRQREMAQMIDPEMGLETIRRTSLVESEHTSIVHQPMYHFFVVVDAVSKVLDGDGIGQIERSNDDVTMWSGRTDVVSRTTRSFLVATRKNDPCISPSQVAGCLETDTGVRSSHDEGLPRQTGNGRVRPSARGEPLGT